MAVVSRISTLRFDNGLGSFRQWQVTAAVQDTAEGQGVTWSLAETSGGTPPGAADTRTVRFKDPSGAVLVSTTATSGTFYFTNDGTSGGSARHGTVIIDIQATKTTVPTYDYETDGSPSTAPTGFSATQVDRGYIRGTTTLVESVSNISLGGAQSEPAAYDESLYFRCTLGSSSYIAQALTVTASAGSLSSATNSTTATTRDVTFANVVDDRFNAALTTVTWTVTPPNDATTGIAYTAFSSTTDTEIDVDPRLTCSHHFQIDDNTFDTSDASSSNSMLSTQSGFLATRFVNSRGVGINGLTVTQTLTPVNPGTAASASSSTATRDSQDGWTDLLSWTASKPGGTWNKTLDVTSPLDIELPTYLVSDTASYTMVADDPRLSLRIEAGDPANPGDPWLVGDDLVIGVAAIRFTTTGSERLEIDTGTCKFTIAKFNPALLRIETLASDKITWEYTQTPYLFSATVSPTDPYLFLNYLDFPAAITTQWGDIGGVFIQGYAEIDGIPKTAGGNAGDPEPPAAESSVGGGGPRFITITDQEKEKRRRKLEEILDKDFSSGEFNSMLSGLVEKFKTNNMAFLSDDEEALFHILVAINLDDL